MQGKITPKFIVMQSKKTTKMGSLRSIRRDGSIYEFIAKYSSNWEAIEATLATNGRRFRDA